MILILIIFSLNLIDIFSIDIPFFFKRYLNKIIDLNKQNSEFYQNFFLGSFITILSTPCSAPFVGTAITIAFTQGSFLMIGIFLSMGLGMASPYILVSIFPKPVEFLPKPGVWMNTVKFILGLLLLGTLVWIGFILQNHFNYLFILICVALALIITLSIKLFFKVFVIHIINRKL